MNSKISKYLDSFRKVKAFSDLNVALLKANLIFLTIAFILIIIESLFYLQTQNRLIVINFTLSVYLTIHFYIILR